MVVLQCDTRKRTWLVKLRGLILCFERTSTEGIGLLGSPAKHDLVSDENRVYVIWIYSNVDRSSCDRTWVVWHRTSPPRGVDILCVCRLSLAQICPVVSMVTSHCNSRASSTSLLEIRALMPWVPVRKWGAFGDYLWCKLQEKASVNRTILLKL